MKGDLVRREREDIEFLPAALEVMEMPPSPAGRAIAWAIMAFFVIALVWACVGTVDVVAIAQGKILPAGRSKVIQPLEVGVVRRIHVEDGREVMAGDVLIELDPTTTSADRARLVADLVAAKTEAARLRATLVEGDPLAAFKPPPTADGALRSMHRGLLISAIDEHRARMAHLGDEASRRKAELSATTTSVKKLEITVPMLRERVQSRIDLAAKGFVSRTQLLELQQQLIEQEQELIVQQHRVEEAAASIASLENQRKQAQAEFMRNNLTQLADAEKRAASLSQEVRKAEQRNELQTLAAPIDGVVQQLVVHTVGGVVTEAQPLMVIVPKDDVLEVEARLPNKDIGFVRVGQDAEIKLDAYPFTKYGTIPGIVATISRDAVQDERLGLLYPVRVKLRGTALQVGNQTLDISPGMAATVEIKTESRLLIEYLLSPVLRYRQESMRER